MISALLIAVSMTFGLSTELPVSYTIDVRLDTADQKLYGSQTIQLLNPTSESLDRIVFHLYPNAFSDTGSVYCREDQRIKDDVASGNVSLLDVSGIVISGKPVDSSLVEISGTLMYITLKDPLPPGRRLEIGMDFELVIPRAKVRFGHNGRGDYLFSHWYPILCGYQKGKLIDREYHANSEFFSNFGSYDVTLKLPSDFIVGSTGKLDLLDQDDSLSIWHAAADTVIDFAFACGRNFEKLEADTLGVRIEYLLSKGNTGLFERIDNITKFSLSLCSEKLFAYPYDKFTFVDFDCGSAGLELPGMIVAAIDDPRHTKTGSFMESLIAHEIAHEWFYGTIASNETDDPWLDEGFASYFTAKIMKARNDTVPEFSIFGYGFGLDELSRIFTLSRGISYPIDLASYDYPNWFEYESAVYTRANMVIQTLENVIGDTLFEKALKSYAETYRFGHPDSDDFEKSISTYTELDLEDFYRQFFSGTARVDYAVTGMRYESIGDEKKAYKVTVDLGRIRDGILPQTLSLALESGSVIDTVWDGRARIASFKFETVSKPVYAAIDEHYVSPLDEQSANDRLYIASYWSRLISFDWDSAFFIEVILSLLL